MTGLALILALAVGQAEVKASDLAVRIRCYEGKVQDKRGEWVDQFGFGSGTILASNEAGEELVLTARHVTRAAKWIQVQYNGKLYPGRMCHQSAYADLAAVTVDLPGKFADTPLVGSPATKAAIWGYGKSGNLHLHQMTRLKPLEDDDQYTPGGNEGDSGAGVFNESGELSGVFVAQRADNANAITVPSTMLCQFLGARQTASGSKRVVIFPFFWKRVNWGGGSAGSCPPGQTCEPAQPGVTVQAPGVGVQVGQPPEPAEPTVVQGPAGKQGPQGLAGKDGQPGKDAPPVDTQALTQQIAAAVLKAIEGNPAFVGKAGKDGTNGKDGVNGKDGSGRTGNRSVPADGPSDRTRGLAQADGRNATPDLLPLPPPEWHHKPTAGIHR